MKGAKLGFKSLKENYAKTGKAHDSSEEELPRDGAGLEGTKLGLKSFNDNYAKAGKAYLSSEGAGGGSVGFLWCVSQIPY